MILWLWDADGPARTGRGVTNDETRAIKAAEACMRNGQARIAKVEAALLVLGIPGLTPGYKRTGNGWRGRCGDTGIRWEPFGPVGRRAAS